MSNFKIPKKANARIPRHWGLVAPAEAGKSTFLTAMGSPVLIADADNRSEEVAFLMDEIYPLFDADDFNNYKDPDVVARAIKEVAAHPTFRGGIVAIDSITTIMEPIVAEAMSANKRGENTNQMSAFEPKARAMRQLTNACVATGLDFAIIYHTKQSSMARGRNTETIERTTLTPVEEARMIKSLNAVIELGQDQRGRYALIRNCRVRGAVGAKFYDTTGFWKGVPEAIDAHIVKAKRDQISGGKQEQETGRPKWAGMADAFAWGMEVGAYNDEVHASNAWDKLKKEKSPSSFNEMAQLFWEDTNRRLAEKIAEDVA